MHSSAILKTFRLLLLPAILLCAFQLRSQISPQHSDSIIVNKKILSSWIDSIISVSDQPQELDRYYINAYQFASEAELGNTLYRTLDSLAQKALNSNSYELALTFYRKAFELAKDTRNASRMATCYNNIGSVYRQMEKFQPAIDYHFKALKISQELNDLQNMAHALSAIGNINFLMGNYHSALNLLENALIEEQQAGTESGMADNLNSIGNVYFEMGSFDTARYYLQKSLELYTRLEDVQGQAVNFDDIGNVYLKEEKHIEALKYYIKALEINESLDNKRNIAENYLHIGRVFYQMKEAEKSNIYAEKCLELARMIGSKYLISDCYDLISDIATAEGKYREALNSYRLADSYRDSIMNEKNQQLMTRLQAEYESGKQQKDIRLLKSETEIAQLELGRRKIINHFAIGLVILLVVLLAIIMWFNYNNWRKNKLLREKNEEIYRAQQKERLNAERLLEAKELAEQANRTKTLFLANISHEIRTPLNSIIGFTELIAHYITDEKQKTYLESIKSSGRSLLALINDILDLSKIEAGKMDVEYGPVDLKQLFNELKNIFSLKISQKNIDFSIRVDEQLPSILILSESRLRQVLFNMIGNSLKFTEEGTVDVIAEVARVKDDKKVDIRITVKDTGIGIAEENQKRIFEAFSQTMVESMNQTEGTGLGLTISKRLVEIMNGRIELESKLNEGSSFIIHLNDVEIAVGPHALTENIEQDPKEIRWEPATILVVDDLDVNRELIRDIFLGSSIRIIEAENGQVAIQKAVRYQPDLILMDIRMPVLNGLDATKKIKKMVTVRHIPVVGITAYSIADAYEEVYNKVFDSLLIKPVQISKLYKELTKYLAYRIEKRNAINEPGKERFVVDEKNYEKINELLSEDIRKKWLEVSKTHFVNDIMEFALRVRELGKAGKSPVLEEYGNILISHTENLNIELINETLSRFSSFIKTESNT